MHHRDGRTGRKIVVAFTLFTLLSGLVLWGVANQRQRVELSDGLSAEWMGLTEGTNALMDGSLIEQLLGDRIPANGIDLGGLKLRRPRALRAYAEDPSLIAWIRLRGDVRASKFGFYWEGSAVITANSSSREIKIPPARPYRAGPTNETIIYIPLYAFPWDERTVRLRISAPGSDREERRWAEFEFENPYFGKRSNWNPRPLPITNRAGEHEFVLKEVRTNPTAVVFVTPAGNWYGTEAYITDEEGNRSARMGRRTNSNGREQTVKFEYGLEPNRNWKVSATFVNASSKALMGLGDLRETDFSAEDQFLISVSSGGEAWLTNRSGTKYRCKFDGRMVAIGEPGAWEIPYYVVLGATNGAGASVGPELGPMSSGGSLSWQSQGSERVQVWAPQQPCTNLVLHLALPTVVTTEFYVRPDQTARRKGL